LKIMRWKALTTGQLSRNIYWGESNDRAYRSVLATGTVIWDDEHVILVDPAEPLEITGEKLRALDLSPEKVDIIVSTHFHGDHRVDAGRYPNAACYMSRIMMEDFRASIRDGNVPKQYTDGIAGVFQEIDPETETLPGVELISLPGHTRGDMGVLFQAEEGRILAAGDTIITVEFYAHCDGFWINHDLEATKRSIRKASGIADIIIPGHGAPFRTADVKVDGMQ